MTSKKKPAPKKKRAGSRAKPQAEEKPKVGRPSTYRKEFAKQAAKLCELGATDLELAEFFNVTVRTIHYWKADHPEFLHSIKGGKDQADDRVIRGLYQRAVGYSFESEKIFSNAGIVVRAATIEHVPPDVTAAIYWLNNRKSDEWRTRKAVEASGPGGGPIEHEHYTREDLKEELKAITEALR